MRKHYVGYFFKMLSKEQYEYTIVKYFQQLKKKKSTKTSEWPPEGANVRVWSGLKNTESFWCFLSLMQCVMYLRFKKWIHTDLIKC